MKQRRLMHSGDDLLGYNMHDKKRDSGEEQEIQLHKMKPQEHFIEAQVQEDDTLQAIALRFHCSIAELKRINHIHKDNEIFARRTLKVPVTPFSVLTETVPTTQKDPIPSTSNNVPTSQDNTDTKGDFEIDCNEVVMNSTLTPSVIPYTDTEVNEPMTEDSQLLPNKEQVSVETVVVKQLTSQGADLGIKWYHLVCLLLVLGFVVPLWYVLFDLDKYEHSDVPPLTDKLTH